MTITPLSGDRAAHDVTNHPSKHASDLEANTPIHHVPAGGAAGDMLVWDGTKWEAVEITPGGGGGGSWGDITGTLADQTDLQSALDGKISHSLAAAANDFLVASGVGAFVKKTLAEAVTILRTVLDGVYSAIGHTHSSGLEMISDSLLAADALSVTFSSIPQTYKQLKLVCTCRTDRSVVAEYVTVQFNNDTGSNYDSVGVNLQHNGTIATTEFVGQTTGLIGVSTGNTAVSNDFSAFEIIIPDYTSTSHDKSWVSPGFAAKARSSTNIAIYYTGGQHRSTSAITSIKLQPQVTTGKFRAGSRFTLYGMN